MFIYIGIRVEDLDQSWCQRTQKGIARISKRHICIYIYILTWSNEKQSLQKNAKTLFLLHVASPKKPVGVGENHTHAGRPALIMVCAFLGI